MSQEKQQPKVDEDTRRKVIALAKHMDRRYPQTYRRLMSENRNMAHAVAKFLLALPADIS